MLKEPAAIPAHGSDRLRSRTERPLENHFLPGFSLRDRNLHSIRGWRIGKRNTRAFHQRPRVEQSRQIRPRRRLLERRRVMAPRVSPILRGVALLACGRSREGRSHGEKQCEHMIRYHLVWWLALLALADFSAIERKISAGDFRDALAQLESLTERPAAWFVLASKAHDGLNDPAKAVAAAETALKMDPRNEAAHVQLGYIFLARNTPAAAAEIFSEAEQVLPQSVPVRLGKGLALKELLRYDEAEKTLSDCWPHPIAFDALATVYLFRSKFAQTKALAIQFIASNPADYRGHYFLAAARDGLGEKDAADAVRQSLARNSGFAAAHALLGKIQLREGALDQAIESFRAATRLRPDLTQAHLQLAQALQRSGRDAEAAREFATVRELKKKEAEPKPSLLFHRGNR